VYDARNLRQFVLDKSQQSGWASARKSICAIRMFLRFLISQGNVPGQSLCSGFYSRLLAACFAALFGTRSGRKGLDDVARDSWGEIYFPLSVALLYRFAHGSKPLYAVPLGQLWNRFRVGVALVMFVTAYARKTTPPRSPGFFAQNYAPPLECDTAYGTNL
jgi:hypothetical protein